MFENWNSLQLLHSICAPDEALLKMWRHVQSVYLVERKAGKIILFLHDLNKLFYERNY